MTGGISLCCPSVWSALKGCTGHIHSSFLMGHFCVCIQTSPLTQPVGNCSRDSSQQGSEGFVPVQPSLTLPCPMAPFLPTWGVCSLSSIPGTGLGLRDGVGWAHSSLRGGCLFLFVPGCKGAFLMAISCLICCEIPSERCLELCLTKNKSIYGSGRLPMCPCGWGSVGWSRWSH